jgi:hypothetical protein
MRKLVLAMAIAAVAVPAHAAEWRCYGGTNYYWNQSYSSSRCGWVYSEQEIYEQHQSAAERGLDYNSRGGTRRASERACTQALESGVDPDLMRSYGCNP